MTNKPPKHSEQKRAKRSGAKRMLNGWGKERVSLPTIPIRPERILIVTEGTKTEPFYFEGYRRRVNAAFMGEYVTVKVYGLGRNTVSLFRRAKAIAEGDADGYTQVWVVYDKDSFSAGDFNAVADMCKAESGSGTLYRAAWTNEAFELWYIMHFAYVDSALGRDSYEDKLSGHLIAAGCGRYEKNREDMFDVLESRVSFALANAERLEEANQGKTPADANPGTTVHKLVRELLPYIRTSIQ